jgi:hypothetical protein
MSAPLQAWAVVAVGAFAFGGAGALADDDDLSAPLTEKEILAAAPVVAAELRDARAAAGFAREWKERASKGLEDRQAVGEAVREGRVDPLAWSKERYPGLPMPEGYRYSAACSRKATAAHPLFAVVVVLTSGVDSVDYSPERMARLKPEEMDRLLLTDTFLSDTTKKRLAATRRFLESRGLKVSQEHGFPTFEAADGRLGGAVRDHNEFCREMPTGPYVEMSVEPGSPAEPAGAEGPTNALDEALRASRLTEDQYRAIVYRLVRARHFAEDPKSLALAAGDAPEGPEREAERERERPDRRNVEIYTKLKGRLEPQLGELIRFQVSPH